MNQATTQYHSMPDTPLFREATNVVNVLSSEGHTTLFAGGAVRDLLLQRPVHDIDIATSASPDELSRLFSSTHEVGKSFGVSLVNSGEHTFEVAQFRKEGPYSDGRHPDNVCPTSPEQDAARRDFTINGLFYDPTTETIIDYVDGIRDLDKRHLRCIGNPSDRFMEDHLRMLRAIRFAATLNFEMDNATSAAIKSHSNQITRLSPERITDEFCRILTETNQTGDAIRALHEHELLSLIIPHAPYFAHQLLEHPSRTRLATSIDLLNALPCKGNLALALAGFIHSSHIDLTHDFEEAFSLTAIEAHKLFSRLKLPKRVTQAVTALLEVTNWVLLSPHMDRADQRRTLGHPACAEAMLIHAQLETIYDIAPTGRLQLESLAEELGDEPYLPPAWITGQDLLQAGFKQGPGFSKWLQYAYNNQLNETVRNKKQLLRKIKKELKDQPD